MRFIWQTASPIFLTLVFILSGCTTTQSTTEPEVAKQGLSHVTDMSGTWYGTLPESDRGFRDWLIQCFPDGSYVTSYRVFSSGSELNRSWISYGAWRIEDGVRITELKGYIRGNKKEPIGVGPLISRYYITFADEESLIFEGYRSDTCFAYVSVPDGIDFTDLTSEEIRSLRKKARALQNKSSQNLIDTTAANARIPYNDPTKFMNVDLETVTEVAAVSH